MWKRRLAPLVGLVLVGLTFGCSSLPQQYCEVGDGCDDFTALLRDPVLGSSSDSVAVCTANQETTLAAYRANSEDICHEIATAFEAYMACVVEEDCAGLKVDEPECNREYDNWRDLVDEANNRCNE